MSGDIDRPEDWPAVDAAFAFVLPSYSLLASRFEAADTRLTTLLTLACTLTLGAPILAASIRKGIDFGSPWFLLAMLSVLSGVGLGLYARCVGALILPNPTVHFDKNLGLTDWEFKKNAICFAGDHFTANADAIRRKGNAAMCCAVLIAIEVAFLICWIARAKEVAPWV